MPIHRDKETEAGLGFQGDKNRGAWEEGDKKGEEEEKGQNLGQRATESSFRCVTGSEWAAAVPTASQA